MQRVSMALRQAGVASIYLVHGTFLGPDALGILADLSRVAPGWAESLRRWNKQVVDVLAGDVGNFSRQYADALERGLHIPGESSLPVRLCYWSSENHHLGRADGAVRLIHAIASANFAAGSRLLLLGHSHGGNVFALLTNLLGSDRDSRCEFFDRARSFYRSPLGRRIDVPEWEFVRELVCDRDEIFPGIEFDLVTLGTPIRYGWDSSGYSKLLHFVNHRPTEGFPEHQASFPPATTDLWYSCPGDLIHQIGVAGTNLPPPIWAWRSWLADVRLGAMLQRSCRTSDVYARWRLGVRAHDEGENLFVDYGEPPSNLRQHLFGHAVYTRIEWQLFHFEQIAKWFYESETKDEG